MVDMDERLSEPVAWRRQWWLETFREVYAEKSLPDMPSIVNAGRRLAAIEVGQTAGGGHFCTEEVLYILRPSVEALNV